MKVLENENLICFDCDDTLVMWGDPSHPDAIEIIDPNDGSANYLIPHKFHVDLLKKHSGRGYSIIVWSQGGYMWALNVIKALKLEKYVDIIATKPIKYVDDLVCNEWMGQHLYFKDLKSEDKTTKD